MHWSMSDCRQSQCLYDHKKAYGNTQYSITNGNSLNCAGVKKDTARKFGWWQFSSPMSEVISRHSTTMTPFIVVPCHAVSGQISVFVEVTVKDWQLPVLMSNFRQFHLPHLKRTKTSYNDAIPRFDYNKLLVKDRIDQGKSWNLTFGLGSRAHNNNLYALSQKPIKRGILGDHTSM